VPAQAELSLRWIPPQVQRGELSRGVAPMPLAQVLPDFDSTLAGGTTLGGADTNPIRDMQLATVIVKTPDGWGSGAVISARGWLLTNYHVVERVAQAAATTGGMPTVTVVMPTVIDDRIKPGAELQARLFRADPQVDLALLKLDSPPADLRAFTLASNFADGDRCIAIGSQSSGLAWWVRRGLVSRQFDYPIGLSQNVASGDAALTRNEMNVIVSGIPISPGDSGGPLLNTDGELIGLTFAVPGDANAASVGWHVALPHLQRFLATLPATPEPVPFDVWTAGLGERVAFDGMVVDADGDGRDDAVEFVYALPVAGQETTAVARTLFVNVEQQAPRGDSQADQVPFGLWGTERLGRFRFTVFLTMRDDRVVAVGYTNDRGIVDDVRIGREREDNATTVWLRAASGLWRAAQPSPAVPLIDVSRLGTQGMTMLRAVLRWQSDAATQGGAAGPKNK
jgi:S1-C subfamily serine protease